MTKCAITLGALRISEIGKRALTGYEGVNHSAAHRVGGGLKLSQGHCASSFGLFELVDGLGTTSESLGHLTLAKAKSATYRLDPPASGPRDGSNRLIRSQLRIKLL